MTLNYSVSKILRRNGVLMRISPVKNNDAEPVVEHYTSQTVKKVMMCFSFHQASPFGETCLQL